MSRRGRIYKFTGETYTHYFGLSENTGSIPSDELGYYRLWQCEPTGAWIQTIDKSTDGLKFLVKLTNNQTEILTGQWTLEMKIESPTKHKLIRRIVDFTK